MPSTRQEASQKQKQKQTVVKVNIESFHPDLQLVLHQLQTAIMQGAPLCCSIRPEYLKFNKSSIETFQKGKFPQKLKPILASTARIAIHCGEYNDLFFLLMLQLFTYNKTTMTNLLNKYVDPAHHRILPARSAKPADLAAKSPPQKTVAAPAVSRAQAETQSPSASTSTTRLSHASRSAAARKCLMGYVFVFTGEFSRSPYSREELHHIIHSFGGYE